MFAGADDYVRKPFRIGSIRINIRRVMDKVQLRRQNAELQKELIAKNDQLREIFHLYMAPTLAEKLLASPTLPKLGGERQLVTILFIDLCNFTPLAHKLPPDKVVRILGWFILGGQLGLHFCKEKRCLYFLL
ncbi:hypothetical protein KFU94_27885 [Chloroflexi bacterium TSY]|nr:hypothetical protein [Chloroflexi bacterium TSY]MBV7331982.1 hypothetical protein [Chloroflexi bacterium TSY]